MQWSRALLSSWVLWAWSTGGMAQAPVAETEPAIPAPLPANGDWLARCAPIGTAPWCVEGVGYVLDSSHPNRPDDARRYEARLRIAADPVPGELELEVLLLVNGEGRSSRYFARRERLFQVDEAGAETALGSFRDLSAAAIAALHPRCVVSALRERREAWSEAGEGLAFAWNDALWKVERAAGRVSGLSRALPHEQYGDGVEELRFEEWNPESGEAGRVVVLQRGREVARFDFGPVQACAAPKLPGGDGGRDRTHAVTASEIVLVEVAPHVFSIDLARLDTRITVAEFQDHLVVLEGAYSSRVCDLVASVVQVQLGKPVRYFAFSHLHAQYLGGVRSWIHAGATVLCPPTTIPLVERIATTPHTLRPDALAAQPRAAEVQAVEQEWVLADELNEVVVYNIDSGHTDEYLIFHFPRQRVVLSGDLVFYRPGEPLTGRSRLFCETVAKLGLDFDTVRCTWPLDGSYGTRNVVTRDELLAAYAAGK